MTSSIPSPLTSPTAKAGPRRFCRIGKSGCWAVSSTATSRDSSDRFTIRPTSENWPTGSGFSMTDSVTGEDGSVTVPAEPAVPVPPPPEPVVNAVPEA